METLLLLIIAAAVVALAFPNAWGALQAVGILALYILAILLFVGGCTAIVILDSVWRHMG